MRRPLLGWLALGSLALLGPTARAQTPEQMRQAARFVAAFQNPDGGFAPRKGEPSSLGSTSSAVRSLKHVGGSIPDALKCIDYVRSCFHGDVGGFAPTPGGQPDANTTAVGLMAIAELRAADDAMVDKAVAYLTENAKSFEEVRLAVAGLEAVKRKSPAFDRWERQVKEGRHDDGTWGEGGSKAFDTGGRTVALLRMGVEPDHKDNVLAAMRQGQQADGGFSADGGESSLTATYRIMRGFSMMDAAPDLDALRSYIARHRNDDGGYALKPGGPSELGACYYATIVNMWARLLAGEPAVVETAAFRPLIRDDLDGWEGNTMLWSVRDGVLVGKSPGIKENQFLASDAEYGDFILKFTFRLLGGEGNSGVQFRSKRIPGTEMSGYQADVGQDFWGCLYDESRRNRVLVKASDRALATVKKDGWNQYVIRAMGPQINLTLNNVGSVNYREEDDDIADSGRIATQIHAGGPMEVRFKDMYIQPLPRPAADDADTPGFHLRTAKTSVGDRKYSIYLPVGYDPDKAYPVALFLHGSGERGDDGIRSAQVGLGASIQASPEGYPLIAVFPQARQTWQADSDDAKAALEILDEVTKRHKVEPGRVILTGLSMGGAGSWSIGAANPDRFAAVVPVCGFGDPKRVGPLKGLPVWTLVGDADSERILQGTRSLVRSLRAAGAQVKETEYRGVGHNSWDRAYSDPDVIAWMLAQSRQDAK